MIYVISFGCIKLKNGWANDVQALHSPQLLKNVSSLWNKVPEKEFELNRFHQAARNLSEEGQRNIRILRNWAKSRGWRKMANPDGRPEKWGEVINGKFKPRLIIKPEPSIRPEMHPISRMSRFEARLDSGAYSWINPFTGQIGDVKVGGHVWLENPYLSYEQQLEYLELKEYKAGITI